MNSELNKNKITISQTETLIKSIRKNRIYLNETQLDIINRERRNRLKYHV